EPELVPPRLRGKEVQEQAPPQQPQQQALGGSGGGRTTMRSAMAAAAAIAVALEKEGEGEEKEEKGDEDKKEMEGQEKEGRTATNEKVGGDGKEKEGYMGVKEGKNDTGVADMDVDGIDGVEVTTTSGGDRKPAELTHGAESAPTSEVPAAGTKNVPPKTTANGSAESTYSTESVPASEVPAVVTKVGAGSLDMCTSNVPEPQHVTSKTTTNGVVANGVADTHAHDGENPQHIDVGKPETVTADSKAVQLTNGSHA
ncbi:hypothetical protein HK102_004422, partial [Quaeritorhiza haematococci]